MSYWVVVLRNLETGESRVVDAAFLHKEDAERLMDVLGVQYPEEARVEEQGIFGTFEDFKRANPLDMRWHD